MVSLTFLCAYFFFDRHVMLTSVKYAVPASKREAFQPTRTHPPVVWMPPDLSGGFPCARPPPHFLSCGDLESDVPARTLSRGCPLLVRRRQRGPTPRPASLWGAPPALGGGGGTLSFPPGVRAPGRQQVPEAGGLRPGHHRGRPPLHSLRHPDVRGSGNHRRDRVSASRVATGGPAGLLRGPETRGRRAHPDRVSDQVSSTLSFLPPEVGAFFPVFPLSCQLLRSR